MKKRRFCLVVLIALLGGGAISAIDYTVDSLPNPSHNNTYLADPDGLLTAADTARIDTALKAIERTSSVELAVVIVKSIGGETPKTFATALFKKWGIGKKVVDNGLLLLVVTNNRRTEIETGYGMEGILPDVLVKRIIDQDINPQFKTGNYGEGLWAGVSALRAVIEKSPDTPVTKTSRNKPIDPLFLAIMAGICALVAFFIQSNYFSARRKSRHLPPGDQILQLRPQLGALYGSWFFLTGMSVISLLAFWSNLWLGLPLFLSLHAYSLFLVMNLRQRLKAIRYQPRICPQCAGRMERLTEAEEDPFLKPGQLVEEKLESIDYDVWHCPRDGQVVIDSYAGLHPLQSCPQCQFQTLKELEPIVDVAADFTHAGSGRRPYHCENCGHQHEVAYTIPILVVAVDGSSDSSGGGSDSSGSDFGGGDSGGGGAGGDW